MRAEKLPAEDLEVDTEEEAEALLAVWLFAGRSASNSKPLDKPQKSTPCWLRPRFGISFVAREQLKPEPKGGIHTCVASSDCLQKPLRRVFQASGGQQAPNLMPCMPTPRSCGRRIGYLELKLESASKFRR